MGTIFRPTVTRPLPSGAEIVERDGVRTARWRNGHGKKCEAEIRTTPRGDCVVSTSAKYLARFRDGEGVVQTIATGCRDESAARAVLVQLERRAEMVRAGILTPAEDACIDHRRSPIGEHVEAYIDSLRARSCAPKHVLGVLRRLTLVMRECRFKALQDIKREAFEKWLGSSANARRSNRTKNTYVAAMKAFCKWCVEHDRLSTNPVARVQKLDEQIDRRRQPRAFTEDELVRLLDAARRRPLAEAMKFNRGWRRGQNGARLRPETITRLERLGYERALTYRVLMLTGLRLGELRSIRVCDVGADHLVLDARHEKNRRGSTIPLRADLAAELHEWIGERREGPLFAVSQSLLKSFDRDLAFAGIAKRDDRGRTACLHGIRHAFATLLSRRGVAPRVAQAAMRHSSMHLTMQHYTDPRLLDVAGAMTLLPELPLNPKQKAVS